MRVSLKNEMEKVSNCILYKLPNFAESKNTKRSNIDLTDNLFCNSFV